MITFVTGKPGDGKTMYGMKVMVQTLLHTEKVVATNIAVRVPELRAYLIKHGWKPKPGNDIHDRLIILDHEDVFEFYRHRSGGYTMPPSPDWKRSREQEDADGNKIKKVTRFQLLRVMTEQMREMKKNPKALRPVEYHIDEAHDYFSAREWTDTGRGILWYASKHRHLHDEIILYTQVMANVEGQLRNLASFTVRARNQIRMSWGPFRKKPIFRLYHYYGGPEDTDAVVPFNKSTMALDVEGLCKTYNSAGALSIHDKPEEVKNKAPLPYWALPVGAIALVLLVVGLMAGVPVLAGKAAGAKIKQATAEGAKAAGFDAPSNASVTAKQDEKKQDARQQSIEDFPKVLAVITLGNDILVKLKGYDFAKVVKPLGTTMFELGNGCVVQRSEIVRISQGGTQEKTKSAN